MNRLYYSNFCPHSKNILEFIRKNNIIDKLDFFCVDNRYQDPNTGVIYILSEDKKNKILLPSNIKEVPTLLLVRDKYNIILGNEIINYFKPNINTVFNEINEPVPSTLNSNPGNFSDYNDEINKNQIGYIKTPPENIVNKDKNITIELIEKKRNQEIENIIYSKI